LSTDELKLKETISLTHSLKIINYEPDGILSRLSIKYIFAYVGRYPFKRKKCRLTFYYFHYNIELYDIPYFIILYRIVTRRRVKMTYKFIKQLIIKCNINSNLKPNVTIKPIVHTYYYSPYVILVINYSPIKIQNNQTLFILMIY